jgi:YggT family protein
MTAAEYLLPLAINRVDVASYVSTLSLVYSILIIVRILLTWFPRIPYNRWLNAFLEFVTEVTDPYLNLFRRFVPLVRIGPGALDLSPIIALIVLGIVSNVIVSLIHG